MRGIGSRWLVAAALTASACVSRLDAQPSDAGAPDGTDVVAADLGFWQPASATQVSAGSSTTCFVRDGQGYCWGDNADLELGAGDAYVHEGQVLQPVPVAAPANLVEIHVGYALGCARSADSLLLCWGNNLNDRLGHDFVIGATPRLIDLLGTVSAFSINGGVCALRPDHTVSCAGLRMIPGDAPDGSANPVRYVVPGLNDAVQVAVGGGHACALRTTHELFCWGDNSLEQQGDGTVHDAVQVTAGYGHTCVLRASGGVSCWGDNLYGQLGDGTTIRSSVPRDVRLPGPADEVSAGFGHTCARVGGSVYCWGLGLDGQLGNGGSATRLVPVLVEGLSDAVGLSAGGSHSCAVRASGAAVCWGDDVYGQLGSGVPASSKVPVQVTGL